jgi:RarD protein
VSDDERAAAPYVALTLVQLMFGSTPVVGKVVLSVVPAVAVVGFRVGVTALVLLAFQVIRGRIHLQEKGDYIKLAVLSFFGVTFNQLLYIKGLSLTSAVDAALLMVTIPIFTLTIGSLFGTERLRRYKVIGIILAAAGVIFVIHPERVAFSSETAIGDALLLFNCLSFGTYVATSKSVFTRNGAFRSMMWVFVFAAFICVPLGVWSFASVDVATLSASTWLWLVYLALISTAAPYLLNAWALARVDPSTLAVFVYLQPLIGFILAVVFLHEQIDRSFLVAAALIFAGVYLASRRYKQIETYA